MLTQKSRTGGWNDSFLDLLVSVGFPASVPKKLFQQQNLHSLAIFIIRAVHRQQLTGKFSLHAAAATADLSGRAWKDGIASVFLRIQEQEDENTDPFFPICGTDSERAVFLGEDGALKHFELMSGLEVIAANQEDGAKNNDDVQSASTNSAQRNVSAVVSLIVDGVQSRLAKEVFGANTHAVTAILASLGLCTEQQQQQQQNQNQHSRKIPSTVNGLLWTTLGSTTLQRSVLLQSAIFYVLQKSCKVSFEVDETGRWRCSDSAAAAAAASSSSSTYDASSIVASALSALFSLCALDEDAWYLFPTDKTVAATAGLLHVLSVLGFVSLRRAGPEGKTPVFRVLPELRDAALAHGTVSLPQQGALDNNNNIVTAAASASGLARHNVATTDCVVVETNFRVYVHLVPVAHPRTGQPQVSHQGETLLAVLRTFLEPEEMVLPVFAVFRLTRDSYLRALRNGLTTEAIVRFLEAKAHPMAVAHYSASSSSSSSGAKTTTGVPKALYDQLLSWGQEAERITLKPNHILITFPSSMLTTKMLKMLVDRLGVQADHQKKQQQQQQHQNDQHPDTADLLALLQPSVMMPNAFQLVIPEKMWPLVSDVLPSS